MPGSSPDNAIPLLPMGTAATWPTGIYTLKKSFFILVFARNGAFLVQRELLAFPAEPLACGSVCSCLCWGLSSLQARAAATCMHQPQVLASPWPQEGRINPGEVGTNHGSC